MMHIFKCQNCGFEHQIDRHFLESIPCSVCPGKAVPILKLTTDVRPCDFVIAGQGETIVTLRPDGTTEVNPKYTATEAARVFWAALAEQHRSMFEAIEADRDAWRIRAEEMRAVLEYVEWCGDSSALRKCCPCCESEPHAADCALAKVLGRST